MVRRGETPPKKRDYELATIGSSAQYGMGFRAICGDCGHQTEFNAAEFMARHNLHPDTTFYAIVNRMRCGKCESTRVEIMISAANPYSDLEKRTGVKGAGIGGTDKKMPET